MIRRVAFKKAIIAGFLGAAGWEVIARALVFSGVQVFDLVRTLGTLVPGNDAPSWFWWPLGMLMHCIVGSVWAIFYAYFVWSTFRVGPPLQGMAFSLLPAVLAGLIMIPQFDLIRNSEIHKFGIFAWQLGWGGPVMVVLGHIIYGCILGVMYTRPVGYRVGEPVHLNA